ncbi:phage holin family protein [Mycobacterium sp. DL592]|uniref:phage holin family protein n=1 Tax=Mycobacterium sp. DL592 TaxID=2675524 RepID=UPI0014228C72|nr:phage holin family protein [Mycobacterium sp. DL592]
MLIVALVLAVVGLAALVTAVVTSNELVAWVCIAASVLGVILLIVDAIRERQHGGPAAAPDPEPAEEPAIAYSDEDVVESTYSTFDADYPADELAEEQHPDEVVSEDPEADLPSDDEPELPEPAEEAAVHPVETAGEPDVTEDTDRR